MTAELNEMVQLVFEGPARSGFFPFWARTGTATDYIILRSSERSDRTVHNRFTSTIFDY